jgi:hypothetical protein
MDVLKMQEVFGQACGITTACKRTYTILKITERKYRENH